jgi:hypothetical protein
MYLLNYNSIDKSNVCISTKVNISTLYIYIYFFIFFLFFFKTLNDISYIKFIKNYFLQQRSKHNNLYSPKINKNPT